MCCAGWRRRPESEVTPLLAIEELEARIRRNVGRVMFAARWIMAPIYIGLLVALAMVAIIAMAALSIDVSTLYLAREESQRTADAAALAAARVISISGMTGDPANSASSWQAVCGGTSSPATQAAKAVATQNAVGNTVGIVQ